jgi:hypothetical protein
MTLVIIGGLFVLALAAIVIPVAWTIRQDWIDEEARMQAEEAAEARRWKTLRRERDAFDRERRR